MASFLARDAALPSGRAGLLGSGRLHLAPALPGHGALVFAGRRVGAGHGGVLAVQFMAPVRDAKSSYAKNGNHPDGMAEDDDAVNFDALKDLDSMYKKFEAFADILLLPPPPPAPLSQEEEAFQEKLKEITERCLRLHMDAMARLRPVQLRPLYSMVDNIYITFARVAVAAKEGRANSGMVVVVADTLDLVRKLVSYICKTHLPLQGPKNLTLYLPDGPAFGRESDGSNDSEAMRQAAWIAVLESLYTTAEDIDDYNRAAIN